METIRKEIRETDMNEFDRHFKHLQRKAQKLGLEEPSYRIAETHLPRERKEKIHAHADPYYYVNILEIDDVNIKLEGWQLAGIVDNRTLFTNNIGGKRRNGALYTCFEKLPKSCFDKNPRECEHCKLDRFRNTTYILRNIETGEYKQVGSTCVEDFLETKNVAQIVNYINSWYEGTVAWESDEPESKDTMYVTTHYLMALCTETVDLHGYNTMNSSDPSVKRILEMLVNEYEPEDCWYEKAEKIIEYYEEHQDGNDYNDFKYNAVKTAVSYSVIPTNLIFSYLCACVRDYNKAMERATCKQEHYGVIGEKYEFDDAVFVKATTIGTMWGETVNAQFIWNGYRISALTNINTRIADTLLHLEKGEHVNFIAKVKKHDVWKDEYYTNVSGMKIF